MKTRKSALKRFRITKRGKVIHRGHGGRHLKSNKTKKRLRRLKQAKVLTEKMAEKIRRMLGK